MKLHEGVNLHIIKETKFKTVRLMIRFRESISKGNLAKRALISNLWETSNAIYPNNKAFSRALSEMYGASFSTAVAKKGQDHLLTLGMTVVNPKFIGTDTVLSALEFIHHALFMPLLDKGNNQFDQATFEREQKNLIHYLEAMDEDRAYFAGKQLVKLFYQDQVMAMPSVSTVDTIGAETAASVLAYYQEMLQNNEIDIFILGDVDAEQLAPLFEDWPFAAREQSAEIFYQQEASSVIRELTEEKEVAQSILQLAYHLPVRYGDKDYLTLQVFNGILGAFPHSKLFKNVREKESLAYYASSSFDSYTGFLKIAAGIDAKNAAKAQKLIREQLIAIQKGDISDEEISQTKTMIENSYFMSLDSSSSLIEQAYLEAILPERYIAGEQFIEQLKAVTKDDLIDLAKKIKLQAIYLMEGGSLADGE